MVTETVSFTLPKWWVRLWEGLSEKTQPLKLSDFPVFLGLGLLWVFGGGYVLGHVPEKDRDLIVYASTLVLLPPLMLLYQNWFLRRTLVSEGLSALMATLVLALCIWLQPHARAFFPIIACLLQYLAERFWWPRASASENWRGKIIQAAVLFCVWSIASLLYWPDIKLSGLLIKYGAQPPLVLLSLLAIYGYGLRPQAWQAVETSALRKRVCWGLFLLITIPMGVYFYNVVPLWFSHHWGFFCGPAELIRRGGWLLHDIPSQYGFLNILLLAMLPFSDAFQSLFWAMSFLNIVSTAFFFAVAMRTFPKSWMGYLMALLLITATFYFTCGWLPMNNGASNYPSLGPFRFFGIYAFSLLLLVMTETSKEQKKLKRGHFLMGHALWLLTVLWSFESGVYCTAMWIPASLLFLAFDSTSFSRRERVGLAVAPMGGLAVAFVGISLYYYARNQFWPDWYAFVEYPLAYARGFGYIPVEPRGPVWFLVTVLVFQLFTLMKFLRDRKFVWLPALVGIFCGFWITCSYYATRSHDNNITSLLPVVLVGLLVYLGAYLKEFPNSRADILRFSLPLMVVSTVMVFGQKNMQSALQDRIDGVGSALKNRPLLSFHIEPTAEEKGLLLKAGARPEDELTYLVDVAFVWNRNSPNRSVQQFMLPITPYMQFRILSGERKRVYLERWKRLLHSGARSFVLAPEKQESDPVLTAYLAQNFRKGITLVENGWRVDEFFAK